MSAPAEQLATLAGHTHLIFFVDGSCRVNPGPMGLGIAVYSKDRQPLLQLSEPIGRGTNNVAEYKALIRALEVAKNAGATHVAVYSDSELVVFQVQGRYRALSTAALCREAKELAAGFAFFRIIRIGREKNKVANDLAQAASARSI